MTNQETFDIVATHLLKQGRRSIKLDETASCKYVCMYRNPEGLKCAAGILIPDNVYDPMWEGVNVYNNPIKTYLESLGHNVDLVEELQHMHDHVDPDNWERKLIVIANDWELNPQVVHAFRSGAGQAQVGGTMESVSGDIARDS